MAYVLDSSAVLAWLQQEKGSEQVRGALGKGVITAANWSEVLQKTRQYGGDPHEVGLLLRSLGLGVIDVTREDAEAAARLWTREDPLSLGDRLCLAAAIRVGRAALTADLDWERVEMDRLAVEVINRR